jgi:hypothetical protein
MNFRKHLQRVREQLKGGRRTKRPASEAARPRVESLETRTVPTVTFHGGAVLAHVEVQGFYYGADWQNNSTYLGQTVYLEGFLKNIVSSSYMDMVGGAGYGAGRGGWSGGKIAQRNLDKTRYLTDAQIRSDLLVSITGGVLEQPDANRLYVIFVEDNVAVSTDFGNSRHGFLGYHGAFAGRVASGTADIHYAVIPYPGGSVGNASQWWLGALDTMTLAASQELAEAVTDPDMSYKALGWYDSQQNGEVGDLVNTQAVYLNGYAVQRIADKNDQAMTPADAAGARQVNFVLQKDGTLYESDGSGLTFIARGAASVSDQGIDNYGRAMVDVVFTNGAACEYHDGIGSWSYLGSGVKSARADQGASYVLFNNGTLEEFKESDESLTFLASSVSSIDAGTDRYGADMVTVVQNGRGWEHSDSTGWRLLGNGVKAVSAGAQGIMDVLYTNGTAYCYNEATNIRAYLGSNVAVVTAGTDQSGKYMIDLLLSNGTLDEYRVGTGWSRLRNGIVSIGKGHAGAVDVVFAGGDCYDHDASGWHYVTSKALGVA